MSWFTEAKKQIVGAEKSKVWRAYTRTGKIVVIEGMQVIQIIDPTKVPSFAEKQRK